MDALKLLSARRSVRKFKIREIKDSDLSVIIDAARLAPTARNIQPWEFILIKDKDTLKHIGEIVSANGSFIAGASACIVLLCSDTKYYLEDGSSATTCALLAATALGIASCWVAGDKKDYSQVVLKFLQVPSGYKLISLIGLGYADEDPKPVKRQLNEVMHKEKF